MARWRIDIGNSGFLLASAFLRLSGRQGGARIRRCTVPMAGGGFSADGAEARRTETGHLYCSPADTSAVRLADNRSRHGPQTPEGDPMVRLKLRSIGAVVAVAGLVASAPSTATAATRR